MSSPFKFAYNIKQYIKLFPNPTMGTFSVTFNNNQNHQIQIMDVNGKVIHSAKNISAEKWNFDISEFSSGTYLIKVLPENITYQIIKQ